MNDTRNNQEIEKIEKEIFRKRVIPKISKKQVSYQPLDEETACNLFKAYFNNKMTVILLLLQKRKAEPDSLAAMKAVIFFDDLFHHMLKAEFQQSYHRVFQWLRLFFKRFPYVKPIQKRKAMEYIRVVYQLFGINFNARI